MKDKNRSNRRFCYVRDLFYNTVDDCYMICIDYYKSDYMKYVFKMFTENGEFTQRKFYRDQLDHHWDHKEIVNIPLDKAAKILLSPTIKLYL